MSNRNEIIERLENLAKHAVHYVGEPPFVMSLDDGIALHDAIALLKAQEPRVMARWEYKHRHRKSYKQYTGFDSMGEIHTITVLEETEGEEPYCSNCGAQAAESFLDYCPRCGAQMTSRPTDAQREATPWG